jgi:hypothetical protein
MASLPSRAETRQSDKQLQGILTPFSEASRCRRHKRAGPRNNGSPVGLSRRQRLRAGLARRKMTAR